MCAILFLFFITPFFSSAEQLPLKKYTTADGLIRDYINNIVRDSRGYLWFCTSEGLSRFDGYEFTNYTRDDGLPHRQVRDLLETRKGVYWIGTNSGLVLFNPKGLPKTLNKQQESNEANNSNQMFKVYLRGKLNGDYDSQNVIYDIFEDSKGTVWIGTNGGLYRIEEINGQPEPHLVDIGHDSFTKFPVVYSFCEDADGSLWMATNSELLRRYEDGRVERYSKQDGFPQGETNDPASPYPFTAVVKTNDGRIWVATAFGLCKLISNPKPDQKIVERIYTTKDGLPENNIPSLFIARDGKLWTISTGGISGLLPGKDERFHTFTKENGLPEEEGLSCLGEDIDGNLWIGSVTGAIKLARSGFTTYRVAEGVSHLRMASIFENAKGEIYAVADHLGSGEETLYRFNENRFTGVKIAALSSLKNWGWGTNHTALQDSKGEWWIPTGEGLYRFPKVERIEELANIKPKRIYTKRDGLCNDDIFRLYEDSRGDIWISSLYSNPALNRWERATEKMHTIDFGEEYKEYGTPASYAEDNKGNLWLAMYSHALVRYRDGQFKWFTSNDDGVPEGFMAGIHVDKQGRLWGATGQDGAFRIDDTSADKLNLTRFTTADGLSGNALYSLTEDSLGRMYFATGRGIDRLDPKTGRIRHYTMADGLAVHYSITDALLDHTGTLWFTTSNGISRLAQESETNSKPPAVLISRILVADKKQLTSELGETDVSGIELLPNQNRLEVKFTSPNFTPGEIIQFQTKLEGSDSDWSALSAQRVVTFANLSPGSYRFLVRAINADGVSSTNPATVSFTVIPPVWRRWWFMGMVALLITALAYALYRYRLKRLIELERVRTRIATDLHDDIGASLSKIAILSEVVHQRVAPVAPNSQEINKPLEEIAETSRELVDSMSDIVWAINPQRDHLNDLIQRMRSIAGEMTELRDMGLRVHLSGVEGKNLHLGTDLRREIYLIFKETINNLIKHSDCEMVNVEFRLEGDTLLIEVKDDGKGFDVSSMSNGNYDGRGGNGLPNMKKRAAALGGSYEIDSQIGKGTTATLRVPLKQKFHLSNLIK